MGATAANATSSPEESIAFSAEISKVLKLMIHSLYTNRDIFLREFTQSTESSATWLCIIKKT